MALIKFFLAVVVFPVLFGSVKTFFKHLTAYPVAFKSLFLWGSCSFVLFFLFLYPFAKLFEFGQKVFTGVFKFIEPANRIIARVFPFYFIVLMVAFAVSKAVMHVNAFDTYFMFLSGFALTMHVLLVAQEMQTEETNPLKPSYLFGMSLITVLNLYLAVLMFDLVFGKWTFPSFMKAMWSIARDMYFSVYHLAVR